MFSFFSNLFRFISWLFIILIITAIAGALYLRTGLPKYNGEIQLEGITAQVEVIRDEHGIPHIYAENDQDAYFALGFVHAQDRLWQMEFQRRVGAGRLSEIFGNRTLDTDKFLRTISVYDYAERSFVNLDAATQDALTIFCPFCA